MVNVYIFNFIIMKQIQFHKMIFETKKKKKEIIFIH